MESSYLNILIVICILCWGAWGIFDKKALKRSTNRDVLIALYTMYLPEIPVLILILNQTRPGWHLTPEVMLWTFWGSLTSTLAMLSYLVAMSKAEASYVLGITASYPLVMQFLASAFLGETLVPNRLIGSALIGIGVTVIGHSAKRTHAEISKKDQRMILLCIIAATFGWGVHGLFDKKAVMVADPVVVFFGRSLWDILSLILIVLSCKWQKHQIQLKEKRLWIYSGFSALSLAIGYFCYLTAISITSASYVIVITGCYPLLMYVFALAFLKEKLNPTRLLGVCLVVIGGLLVQCTQSQ